MFNYVFQFVDKLYFHIGSGNSRYQIAVARLSAVKVAEQQVSDSDKTPKQNLEYEINKASWKTDKVYLPLAGLRTAGGNLGTTKAGLT